MDEEQAEPKISIAEAVFVGLVILVMGLLDFIPLLGPVFNFAFTQIYLRLKGVKGSYQAIMLGGNVLTEIISIVPVLGLLPLALVAFIIVVALEHSPELKRAVSMVPAATGGVGAIAPVATGGVAEEEAAIAARAKRGIAAEERAGVAAPSAAGEGVSAPAGEMEREVRGVYGIPEEGIPAEPQKKPGVSEEQFGMPREELEKLKSTMERPEEIPKEEKRREEEPLAKAA